MLVRVCQASRNDFSMEEGEKSSFSKVNDRSYMVRAVAPTKAATNWAETKIRLEHAILGC